jgi:hypothetical protein
MSGVSKKLMSAAGSAGGGFTAIEDVFSTYLYTGGTAQQINNGIDLDTEGGMVWIKRRNSTFAHQIFDTQRTSATYGTPTRLSTNTTSAADVYFTTGEFSWLADGFDLNNTDGGVNGSGGTYASWTFRKAPRFFDVVTYTGNGSSQQIAHNLGVEPGCIIVKNTGATANWCVYHRGTSASAFNQRMQLNTTDAVATSATAWNGTAPTDTEFSVGNFFNTNASGNTYVAYLYAHDPLGPSEDGSDGLISCGSYTGNGSASGPEIDLGWEPQWLLTKRTNSGASWQLVDTMRLMASEYRRVFPDTSAVEDYESDGVIPTATGFKLTGVQAQHNASGGEYIYIAIRRGPMRVPESGTEVFDLSVTNYTANAIIAANIDVTDTFLVARSSTSAVSNGLFFFNRRTANRRLRTDQNFSENAELGLAGFDTMYGVRAGSSDSNASVWDTGAAIPRYIKYFLKEAPGFHSVVAYTGNGTAGRTVPHNLGVAPEMMLIKRRDGSQNWAVYHSGIAADAETDYLVANSDQAAADNAGFWNDTKPAQQVFTVSTNTNNSGATFTAYLFATLAGVSKVGFYTGNGSSQTIDCGFTAGARFVLIKRSNGTGDWYFWDTARGIVVGDDPYLALNWTNQAEVRTNDSVDPDSSGFIVNQVAASNINVSAARYTFYAIA